MHHNEQKGNTVKPTEHTANTASTPKTGLFAMLGGLLGVKGIGAPVVALCALVGALACTATPALAFETPEKPEVLTPEPIWATTATLHGVLDRGKAGSPGTFELDPYEYLYKESKTECKGGGKAPVPAGMSLGEGHEVLPLQEITGLTPNKEYTVCLVVRNTEATPEEAISAPVTFKTKVGVAPEMPEATGASEVKAATAKLEGVLNPAAEGEAGKYQFVYRQNATECTGAGAVETAKTAVSGSPQGVSAEISGLTSGKPYSFCVKAFNALGEATLSTPKPFTTAIPPQTPKTGVATGETATTAVLHGELNPTGPAETGWHFSYSTGATCLIGGNPAGGEGVAPVPAKSSVPLTGPPVELTGLEPHQQYKACLVASNSAGEEIAGNEVSFETLLTPLTITSETATEVKSATATLNAQINPDNVSTTYEFEYATNEALSENVVKRAGATPLEGNGAQTASVVTGTLSQGTTYDYRVIAKNTKGEEAQGKVQSFTTVPAAHTDPVSELSASTVLFNGHLTQSSTGSSYHFDYKASATECEEAVTPTVQAGTGTETLALSAQATGLTPATEYAVCLVTTNASGSEVGPVVSFTTPATGPPDPVAASESATEVASTSAKLNAEVVPNGAETTYTFQYGTTTAYGNTTTATALGAADDSAHPASAEVQGLTPATLYHYRVLATNETEGKPNTVVAADGTFTTQAAATAFTLPDGRAYEMVSPPLKNGARITQGVPGMIRSAAAGNAITYISKVPTESEPAGFANNSQDLATRGPSGWTTRDLSVPHELSTAAAVGPGPEYRFFSSDLSHAIVQPVSLFTPCVSAEGATQPCLSPAASEQTAFSQETATGVFSPFVTGCPATGACPPSVAEHANVAPGSVFGGEQEGSENKECKAGNYCGPFFVAGTPDLSHVLLESDTGLTEGPGADGGLYEAAAGKLTFVGHGENEAEGESANQQGAFAAHGAHGISGDGSRVIFSGKSEGKSGLLLRDTASEETVELHKGLGKEENQFQDASADDSRVFFDASWEGELDVFELTSAPGEPLAGHVTDLTEGKGMRGLVLGASEDGSYVYFVSEGALTGSGATTPGDDNLYVDHYNGTSWKPTFISTLSSEDSHDWDERQVWGEATLQDQPTRVSPDGQWLAFMSQASLTGYDNRDAAAGKLDAEVYLYHAQDGGTPSLTCPSCDPTGARPTGIEYKNISSKSVEAEAGTGGAWPGNAFVAANLPGSRSLRERPLAISYQPRFLSDGGRVFFNSADALVPADVNRTEDVYEYEPDGVGACASGASTGSSVYEPVRAFSVEGRGGETGAGCVALISSGTSSEESAFLDASEGGGEGEHGQPGTQGGADVFFLTSAKLSPQDQDTAYDIYDAHVCTSASPCIAPASSPPAPCDSEASCRPAQTPTPSIYGPPSSSTFSGPGNLTPAAAPAVKTKAKVVKCKKGYAKNKKGKCVKKKKKKTRAEKASKSNGRAKS
jgi:Tol biopolymer transport system component